MSGQQPADARFECLLREIFVGTKFDKNTMTYIYDAYRTIAPSQLPADVFDLKAQHPDTGAG
jgi:hypothetical protein